MPNTQDRPPLAEISKRTAEAGAGLAAAAKAGAVRDHLQMLSDNRKRMLDGYRYLAKSAGHDVSKGIEQASDGADDMGNITVTGDINVGDPAMLDKVMAMLNQQQKPQQPQQPVTNPLQAAPPSEQPEASAAAQPTTWKDTLKRYALPVLLGTAIGGAPLGWALSQYLGDKPTSYEGYKYDVEKWIPEAKQ